MRIIYLMCPTSANMATCSVYHTAKHFIKRMADRGHYIYWCAPDRYTKSVRETEPEYIDRPEIKWIDIDSADGMSRKTYHFLSRIEDKFCDLFRETNNGVYHYDAIVTGRHVATAYLQSNLFSPVDRHRMSVNPPIYNAIPYVFSPKNPSGAHYKEFEIAQALGMIGCYNVVIGKFDVEMLRASARKYLSFAALNEALSPQKALLFSSSLMPDRLDPYYRTVQQRRKNKEFAINFANAESGFHQFEQFVKRVSKLYAAGRKIKMVITATSQGANTQIPEHMLTWPGVERYVHLPQTDFYKKLTECHAFIAANREGETSPSVWEQLYLGLIGMIPNKGGFRELVPKGYPYLYNSPAECEAMIRELADRYYNDSSLPALAKSCHDHIAKGSAFIRNDAFIDHIEHQVHKRTGLARYPAYVTDTLGSLKKAKKGTKITFNQLRKFVKEKSRNGLDITNIQARLFPSRLLYSWYMRKIGFRDTCKTEMPVWIKE